MYIYTTIQYNTHVARVIHCVTWSQLQLQQQLAIAQTYRKLCHLCERDGRCVHLAQIVQYIGHNIVIHSDTSAVSGGVGNLLKLSKRVPFGLSSRKTSKKRRDVTMKIWRFARNWIRQGDLMQFHVHRANEHSPRRLTMMMTTTNIFRTQALDYILFPNVNQQQPTNNSSSHIFTLRHAQRATPDNLNQLPQSPPHRTTVGGHVNVLCMPSVTARVSVRVALCTACSQRPAKGR